MQMRIGRQTGDLIVLYQIIHGQGILNELATAVLGLPGDLFEGNRLQLRERQAYWQERWTEISFAVAQELTRANGRARAIIQTIAKKGELDKTLEQSHVTLFLLSPLFTGVDEPHNARWLGSDFANGEPSHQRGYMTSDYVTLDGCELRSLSMSIPADSVSDAPPAAPASGASLVDRATAAWASVERVLRGGQYSSAGL